MCWIQRQGQQSYPVKTNIWKMWPQCSVTLVVSYGHPNSLMSLFWHFRYFLLKYSQFFPHFLANIPPCLVVVHPQQLPDPVTQEGGAPLRLLAWHWQWSIHVESQSSVVSPFPPLVLLVLTKLLSPMMRSTRVTCQLRPYLEWEVGFSSAIWTVWH